MLAMNNVAVTHLTGGAMLIVALLAMGQGCVPQGQALQAGEFVPAPLEENTNPVVQEEPMKIWEYQGQLPAERIENKQATIKTPKGDIVIEFFPDVAPITVSNFVYLAEGGYYDGLTFHRVEKSPSPFVIQGGDPAGNGTGGPGYNIPAEFNDIKHDRGVVAMARAMDPDSAGSQFYITLGPAYFLDNNYTVFGRVISGMEVVDQIAVGDVMTQVTVEAKQ